VSERPKVLVLGGGPDAERDVSLAGLSRAADALRRAHFEVNEQVIDTPDGEQLAALEGDVIFPLLHGPWGEGGPLQDLLERDGRPYVGSGPRAARLAMDKVATKVMAATLGIATPVCAVFDPTDTVCPIRPPVVVKPVREGSSFGVRICKTPDAWRSMHEAVVEELTRHPRRVYTIERFVKGRELTVGVIDGRALPVVEINPADGVYDYEAKYHRDDTTYTVAPELPASVGELMQNQAGRLCDEMGVRHIARVDFILDERRVPWLLEVNTMPGFTDHSLVPLAARREGTDFTQLCARLVELAVRDRSRKSSEGGRDGA